MNKEFLFRAFINNDKENRIPCGWVMLEEGDKLFGDGIECFKAILDNTCVVVYEDNTSNPRQIFKGFVMQHTGFFDKYGKHIFAGDIVEYSIDSDYMYNALIIFKDGAYWLKGKELPSWLEKKREKMCRLTEKESKKTKTIGNMYENYELS